MNKFELHVTYGDGRKRKVAESTSAEDLRPRRRIGSSTSYAVDKK